MTLSNVLRIGKLYQSLGEYISGSKALNHPSMRIRWDIFHLVCARDNYSLARQLWEYLNDDNIDSALRKITGII